MATTADLMLNNIGHHPDSLSNPSAKGPKKRRHSLNNCVFEYNNTRGIQTSTVLVVRRGSAEVLRTVMTSVKNSKQNSSSSSNQRTFDILTSSWNRSDLTHFAGLAEIGECNDENHHASIVVNDEDFEKVNQLNFKIQIYFRSKFQTIRNFSLVLSAEANHS